MKSKTICQGNMNELKKKYVNGSYDFISKYQYIMLNFKDADRLHGHETWVIEGHEYNKSEIWNLKDFNVISIYQQYIEGKHIYVSPGFLTKGFEIKIMLFGEESDIEKVEKIIHNGLEEKIDTDTLIDRTVRNDENFRRLGNKKIK